MIEWYQKLSGWWHAEWRGWRLYVWPADAASWGYSVTHPEPAAPSDVRGGVVDTVDEARTEAEALLRSMLSGHERAALARGDA